MAGAYQAKRLGRMEELMGPSVFLASDASSLMTETGSAAA